MTNSSNAGSDLQASIQSLDDRITVLESNRGNQQPNQQGPTPATDDFASHMMVSATASRFTNTAFVRCPHDYYEWPLEERRSFLHGATVHHLTKSIVMENTRHSGQNNSKEIVNSKYLCCIVPYTAKIDSDVLKDAVRRNGMQKGLRVPGIRGFNYRLAADCIGITGFEPNAVTPLGLKTKMPIVVAKQITELVPQTFWLGGGEISLKWRVEWDEFNAAFKPIVLDFATVIDDY